MIYSFLELKDKSPIVEVVVEFIYFLSFSGELSLKICVSL